MARFAMMIVAFLGFVAIFILIKNKLDNQYATNPPGIVCDSVKDAYGGLKGLT